MHGLLEMVEHLHCRIPHIAMQQQEPYQVKLIVTTNNGCKDSSTQNITVYPKPVAGFSTNNNPQCLGINNFTFTNTSTVPSGTITNHNWSFGDGGTSTAQNPTYVYTIAGTYQVKLVVTTNNGCKDSITQNIVINAQPTGVTSTVNNATQCLRNNNFVFAATAAVGGGSVSYAWGFGDGGTSTVQNPTHNYAATGTYQVKLVVTTNLGCKDSTSQTVTVKADAIAEIAFNNQQGCAPYTILPTSVQVINHPTENISYEWYVNGILVGTSISFPGYTVTNDGDTANITLIAISRFGCFNDTANVKFWTVVKPHPAFTLSDTAGCGPLSINITNTTAFYWQLPVCMEFWSGPNIHQCSTRQHCFP
jgi:PKD repeat protein